MHDVEAIFATDSEGGMGLNGRMPWPKLTHDLQNFRMRTAGQILVMGSKTWLSKDMRNPLPDRISAVWTQQTPEQFPLPEGVIRLTGHPLSCIKLIRAAKHWSKIMVVGGAETLKAWMPFCDTVHHTDIWKSYQCDTVYRTSEWRGDFTPVMGAMMFNGAPIDYKITSWRRVQNYDKY